jgi:hypothetical protein
LFSCWAQSDKKKSFMVSWHGTRAQCAPRPIQAAARNRNVLLRASSPA